VPAVTKDKQAVWRFVEFANSVEGQTIIAETGRTVPSLIEVAESPVFLSPDQPPAHSDVFLRAVPVLVHLPILSTWPEIEELADNEIERAFYGQITVEEAAHNINALASEEFKRGASGETD
jgi:multiple sugar transport system substrate-binding protein